VVGREMDIYKKLVGLQLIFIIVSMIQKNNYALCAVPQTLLLMYARIVKFNHSDSWTPYFTCHITWTHCDWTATFLLFINDACGYDGIWYFVVRQSLKMTC